MFHKLKTKFPVVLIELLLELSSHDGLHGNTRRVRRALGQKRKSVRDQNGGRDGSFTWTVLCQRTVCDSVVAFDGRRGGMWRCFRSSADQQAKHIFIYTHTHTHTFLSVKDGKPNLNPPKKTCWPQCLSDPTTLINEKRSVYVRDTDSDGSQNKTQGFFFLLFCWYTFFFFSS